MTFIPHPSARILEDSTSPNGVRLTTMEVTIHRNVLAEFNTHRAFSRNSASSRAIPLETMLQRAIEHPAYPLAWPREQPGMAGGLDLEDEDFIDAARCLADIRDATTSLLQKYIDRHPDKSTRLHKSYLNRPLEWFMYHTIIVTSTDWQNFFKQRCTPQAQPEIRVVAEMMSDVYDASVPSPLEYGQWHLPLLTEQDRVLDLITQLKISAARCARVSYLTHDGVRSIEADLTLFDETLAKHGHWSPLEHVAVPLVYSRKAHQGNFSYPWVQLRALVEMYGSGTLSAVDSVLQGGYHPSVSGFTLSSTTKDAS
jgi:thymidylate synthase ThyX